MFVAELTSVFGSRRYGFRGNSMNYYSNKSPRDFLTGSGGILFPRRTICNYIINEIAEATGISKRQLRLLGPHFLKLARMGARPRARGSLRARKCAPRCQRQNP